MNKLFNGRRSLSAIVSREDYDKLTELAHDRYCSMAALVREAIAQYLEGQVK